MNENLEYYRHSPISDLQSIMLFGLNPDKAKSNLRGLISDGRQKVFYSEGKEGVIICDCGFRNKFKQVKNKQSDFYDERAEEYETMDDFLKANDKGQDRVFLKIKDMELINEQDINKEDRYADAYTSQTIPPEKIYVCLLRNPTTGNMTYRREDVIKYMMSKCSVEDIKKKVPIDEKQEKKLNNQYKEMQDEIQEFAQYEMTEVGIEQFYLMINSIQNGKDGLADCIKDDRTRLSSMQSATRITRANILEEKNIEQTNDERNLE